MLQKDEDPYRILGVKPGAGDSEIRSAYLGKVKTHPPDRSPDQFEKIRDAYELLKDPRRRAAWMLRSVDPLAPLASLLHTVPAHRRFSGPGLWLDVLKER